MVFHGSRMVFCSSRLIFHGFSSFQEIGGQIVNNPKIIGPKMSKIIEK